MDAQFYAKAVSEMVVIPQQEMSRKGQKGGGKAKGKGKAGGKGSGGSGDEKRGDKGKVSFWCKYD